MNRPLTDPGDAVPMYTPALPQLAESFHVLAFGGATMKRGVPLRAILLSDDCAIDTALGEERGRRAQGRLLFAPIVPAKDSEVTKLEERPVFGRFPLPMHAKLFDGGIAELRDCFMVDARDVRTKDRRVTLTTEAAEDLEAAWDACVLRRGPHAVAHNVAKLAAALAGEDGDPEEQAGVVEMIERTLVTAWRLEGGLLRAAADAPVPDKAALQQMVTELKGLEESARAAHQRLSAALE